MKPSTISTLRTISLTGLILLGVVPAILRAGEPAKNIEPPAPEVRDPWRFTLAIPSWLAATSGTIGLDGVNSHVYLGADTLIKHLDMIATFQAEARKGRFGIYGDFLYVSASDGIGQSGLVEKVDVRLDQYLIDMELNYRVIEGPRGFVDVRAGVRYTNLYNKLTISPGDEEIERASADLIDDVGDKVRESLAAIDLKGNVGAALEGNIKDLSDRIQGIDGDRPALPIAPLGAKRSGRVEDVVRAAIDRRVNELAAALRAEAAALTDRLREDARRRVDKIKKQLANEISDKLKSELDNTFSLDEDWWDPYVGLRARLNLSKAFYLTAKADIGGFGVGSDLTWQASGALGCQVSRSIHAEIGYRYLYTDYDHDNFVYKVTQSGAEITVGITF